MTEAEIEALWSQKLSIYEFARAIERDTLERAAQICADSEHEDERGALCAIGIRALME